MSSRRVIVAMSLPPQGETGVHTHVSNVQEALEKRGTPSALVTPYGSARWKLRREGALYRLGRKADEAASLLRLLEGHGNLLRSLLSRELEISGSDLVYAQDPRAAWASLQVSRLFGHLTILVVHFNMSQANEYRERGLITAQNSAFRRIEAFESDVLKAVDGIVYVSGFMKEVLERRIPELAGKRNVVVANFIRDLPPNPDVEVTRDLLSIGSLEARKNHEHTLHVLAQAHARGERYTLDVAGRGLDRERLELLASSLGLSSSVRFLGFQTDARRLLQNYRAYVHSATIENLPVSLLEALCAGKPVFAPAVGGIPEIIDNGQGGYLWPLDDPGRGAEILMNVLGSPETYRQQCNVARQRFLDKFCPAQLSSRLLAFFDECQSEVRLADHMNVAQK